MGEPLPEPAPGEWNVVDPDGNVIDHGPMPVMQAAATAGDGDDSERQATDGGD